MALITEAPATLTGKISDVFLSVPQLNEQTERVNVTVEFDTARVFAIYTNEADQIAALSTQKEYCVFMAPVFEGGQMTLKVAFLGATYTASVPVASLTIGYQITFNKD